MGAIPWRTEVRLLFQAAMAVFVITVGIGMFNGFHIVQLPRQVLLTHVHAGTLGWITLSVLAMTLWLFGEGAPGERERRAIRSLAVLVVLAVPCYVLAFLSGNYIARAVFGVPVLAAIVGFAGWIALRSRRIALGVAHLAVLLAILTLAIGAVIGVLLQVDLATHRLHLPAGAYAAHPTAMVVGYLILIGMAVSEWRVMPQTGRRSRLGVAQVALPFVGGLMVSVGALLNSTALLGSFLPLEIAATLIFVWRFAPNFARTRWLERGPRRHFALIGLFLVVNIALFIYLIVGVVVTKVYADFALIPVWLIFAFDHAMFIGVMSNAIFGLLQEVTAERRLLWPWADDVVFWGMNLGMVGFVLTLVADAQALEKVFTPIMGGSILVGLLAYTLRLQATRTAVQLPALAR